MRLTFALLLFVSFSLAKDPFVGRWIWNAETAHYPAAIFQIEDKGGNRFHLIFPDGTDATLIADGTPQRSTIGSLMTLRRIDETTWELTRKRATLTTTLYKVMDGGTTLTITSIATLANHDQGSRTSKWSRVGSGQGLTGKWRYESAKSSGDEAARELIISVFSKDGLSFVVPADKSRTELKFDGKDYEVHGANEPRGSTVSGKRINSRTLQVDGKRDGKPTDSSEYRLSADGKTMHLTWRPLEGVNREPITGDYEKR